MLAAMRGRGFLEQPIVVQYCGGGAIDGYGGLRWCNAVLREAQSHFDVGRHVLAIGAGQRERPTCWGV